MPSKKAATRDGANTDTTPTTTTPITTTDFNITLALGSNGDQVTIYADDLKSIETKGLHFALPPDTSVSLGHLKDFIDWLNTKFGADSIPDTPDADWPDVIKSIYTNILGATIAVTQLTFDQAPKVDNKWPDPEFSIAVTGTAASPVELIAGISVVGGGVGLSRKNS